MGLADRLRGAKAARREARESAQETRFSNASRKKAAKGSYVDEFNQPRCGHCNCTMTHTGGMGYQCPGCNPGVFVPRKEIGRG